MLVEMWNLGSDAPFDPAGQLPAVAMLPADPANYPAKCFDIAAADWRYLVRFHLVEQDRTALGASNRTPFPQDRYEFAVAANREIGAMLVPYCEKEGAGAG